MVTCQIITDFFGISHNVYVYAGLGFRSSHCPTLLNEIEKTKR
ncbi:hypothetical protein J2W48_003641 [Flavobacterium piscis]|uniref:Uncharacterized protein n=1 Tax=Flavobacterium piscis TaxID=1114874 RepID=A0ABU1YBS0_9FLAO|nr:hypothetical protein [Flavobacterium piscis]